MRTPVLKAVTAAGLLVALLVGGCNWRLPRSGGGTPAVPTDAALRVATTVYPLAWFAEQVGGDRTAVTMLVPSGSDPHTWEPTAATMRAFGQTDVFIYNGAGLEPWVDRLLASAEHDLVTVAASDSDGGIVEGEHDPHVWLDPVLAQQQVAAIAAAFSTADPAGRTMYEANASRLQQQLAALDREFAALAACPRDTFVITSPYFTYPAQRYGLTQQAAAQSDSHDAELRPGQLAQLVRDVRAHGIGYVLAPRSDDRAAQAIARETGAAVLVLHPLEQLTETERRDGLDYMAGMQANVASMRTALGCPAAGG